MVMIIFGEQFAQKSCRFRKLQPRYRGAFIVTEFDEHTQNYTVSLDSRIYWQQRGVFHHSVVKTYNPNDNR